MIPGEKIALEGDIEAQCSVALAYELGFEGSPDIESAAKWWKMAADQGSVFACEKLTGLYSTGLFTVSKTDAKKYADMAKEGGAGLDTGELILQTGNIRDPNELPLANLQTAPKAVDLNLKQKNDITHVADTGKKILIVDDEEIIRDLLQSLLEMNGYQVVVAGNGEEALHVVRKNVDVAALLVDFSMPKINGLDFVKLLRKTDFAASIPVIMITGSSDKDQIRKAVTYGIKSWIIKPFEQERVINTLESLGV